jgi:hypothetical protein
MDHSPIYCSTGGWDGKKRPERDFMVYSLTVGGGTVNNGKSIIIIGAGIAGLAAG